jgi:NAD(P)-dependent dehydrogenase (short-subunit alcohol dehydrogenase family)
MNGLFVSIGAGPGIGGSTASRFAREGFDLVLAARDASRLEPSAQKIRKETGQHVETVTVDATDFSAVQQFSERFGPAASILHYNAAAIQKMDVLETPVETTQRNLSVDILGARRDQVLRAIYGETAQRNDSAHWRRFSACSEGGISVIEYRQGWHPLLGTSSLSSALGKRNPYRNTDGRDDGEPRFGTGDGCG